MKIKKAIIGCNSQLVKKLKNNLKVDIDYFSYADIEKINYFEYDYIFLFSWPRNKHEFFLRKIENIPSNKIFFISTTAVLANQLRKQWNSYPVQKKIFENFLYKNGSKIVRLGITDAENLNYFSGVVPYTSLEKIVDLINNADLYEQKSIDLFNLTNGKANRKISYINNVLKKISYLMPSYEIFQIPLCALSKLIGLKDYGYTSDANNFFYESIQIGYGALGSEYYDKKIKNNLILFSKKENQELNTNGFKKTLIGKDIIGLAGLWHGVYVVSTQLDKFYKKIVPFLVSRKYPPVESSYELDVNRVEYSNINNFWKIIGTTINGKENHFYAKKIILAAGPFENIRILSSIEKIPTKLSDHEIAMVGTIKTKDAQKKGMIKIWGPILIRGHLLKLETKNKINHLIDVRPHVKCKHDDMNSDFYVANSYNIFYKLIKSFNYSRINEAIFNKFGFSIYQRKASIFTQVLVEDCINIEYKTDKFYESVTRNRLDKEDWDYINESIKNIFPTYIPDKLVYSLDAQHLMGGGDILDNPVILKMIKDDCLKILGSPIKEKLDVFHHTKKLQTKNE